MVSTPWHTLLQLAAGGLPVLAAYLLGRHAFRRHLDQVDRDAWQDGFAEGFHVAMRAHLCDDCHTSMDAVADQLDAAVEQAAPSDEPWWN